MSIYYSVSIKKKLVCDCSAYKHPHQPNYGLCKCSPPIAILIPEKLSRSFRSYLVLAGYLYEN